MKLTRREVIAGGVALSACGAPGNSVVDPQAIDKATKISFAPSTVLLDPTVFPQTVSSGAMKKDSVVVWTAASPTVGDLVLRVWREVSDTEVALVKEATLPVPDGGNLKVTVDGLAPGTWYHYGFFDSKLERRSPLGKVRTAFPDDWLEPLTIGATSCASYRYTPFKPLIELGGKKLDFWVHLGDVSYNDGATTLPEYRAKWKAQLADEGYRALMPSTGGYLVWDDHDFLNNVDPEEMGPSHPQILAAKQAWFETLPVERLENDKIWTSYRWGKTAEIFAIDARMERKLSTRESPDAQYLSRAQMDWLKAGLKKSECHFKVILNSVPISKMPPPLWGAQADRWEGYDAAREELLSFIDKEDIKNVWFVSGDFHVGLVMRLEKTGPRRRLMEIAAGPAGNINPLWLVLDPGQEANKKIAFPPEQFLFAGSGFLATVLTFDPKADTVRVVFTDPMKGATPVFDQTLTFGKE